MTKKRKSRNALWARRFALIALALALALGLGGCGNSKSDWEYRPITDVNDLEGRRVAVNLAWESDYLLSGREDLTIVQYDSFADIILALGYDKVDAFAVDGLVWKIFQANSVGLNRVEPPCGIVGYSAYFNPERAARTGYFGNAEPAGGGAEYHRRQWRTLRQPVRAECFQERRYDAGRRFCAR